MRARRTRAEFAREVADLEGLDEALVRRIHEAHDRAYYEASRLTPIPDIEGVIESAATLAEVSPSVVQQVVHHLYQIVTAPATPACACDAAALRIVNPQSLFRQYRCATCGRSYYCLCDQPHFERLGGSVVLNEWRPTLCDTCNDRSSPAPSRALASQHGVFFALHWREITIEHLWRLKQWLSERTAEQFLEARRAESKGNPAVQDVLLEVCKTVVTSDFTIRGRIERRLDSVPAETRERLRREAENLVRSRYDVPAIGEGWVSESALFALIRAALRAFGYDAVAHARLPWLGRQHLDIYIPELRLAIEYMGEQHFVPVRVFGGETGYRRRQQLDARKRRLCAENGVALVEVSYSDTADETWARTLLRDTAIRQSPAR